MLQSGARPVKALNSISTCLCPGRRSSPSKTGRPCSSRPRETILVIDDETSVMELIREALLMGGYNVVMYDDPFKGLEYFRENMEAIDLVALQYSHARA